MSEYEAKFSHEFEAGHSGPARSYWDVSRKGQRLFTVCLHHRDIGDPALEARSICYAMDQAFDAGRAAKSEEIRRMIGVGA